MNKPISIDILLYWYKSAKRRLERGISSFHPHDAVREQRDRESYEMAKKTVEDLAFLEDYEVDVFVTGLSEPSNDITF